MDNDPILVYRENDNPKLKITFKELKEFTYANYDEPLTIELGNADPFGAMAFYDEIPKRILVDKEWWIIKLRKDAYRTKRLILHELGHFVKKHGNSNKIGRVQQELEAQLWSIKRAKKLKDKYLIKETIFHFEGWNAKTFKWNSEYRRYILARNKFIKQKMRY